MSGKFLLIYICNFHVLSNLLLIYICKFHWNQVLMLMGDEEDMFVPSQKKKSTAAAAAVGSRSKAIVLDDSGSEYEYDGDD